VRDFAAGADITADEEVVLGLKQKSEEFAAAGNQIYVPVTE